MREGYTFRTKATARVPSQTTLRLVLLDACRDNPFAPQMRRTLASRSVGRGLASVEPATGTLVVHAAKHGETALDGDGTNSPFAAALVRELQVPGLEVRRMFDFVRDDVLQATNNRQQPFSYGSVPGRQDFYFVAATPPPAPGTRAEMVKLFDRFRLVLARVQSDYVDNAVGQLDPSRRHRARHRNPADVPDEAKATRENKGEWFMQRKRPFYPTFSPTR
jgi:Caspase domain